MPTAPKNAFSFTISNVRLGEFDLGGVLYHGNYFHLYEQAREAFLSSVEVPYSELVKDDSHLAVIESAQQFLAPVFYGDVLTLSLWTDSITRTSVSFHYAIVRKDSSSIIHHATTKHVFVKKTPDGFRPSRFPEKLQSAVETISC